MDECLRVFLKPRDYSADLFTGVLPSFMYKRISDAPSTTRNASTFAQGTRSESQNGNSQGNGFSSDSGGSSQSQGSAAPSHTSDISIEPFDNEVDFPNQHQLMEYSEDSEAYPDDILYIGLLISINEFDAYRRQFLIHFPRHGVIPGDLVKCSETHWILGTDQQIQALEQPVLLKLKENLFYIAPTDYQASIRPSHAIIELFGVNQDNLVFTGSGIRIDATPKHIVSCYRTRFTGLVPTIDDGIQSSFRVVFPAYNSLHLDGMDFTSCTISGYGQTQFSISAAYSYSNFAALTEAQNSPNCLKYNLVTLLVVKPALSVPNASAYMEALRKPFQGSSYILGPLRKYATSIATHQDTTTLLAKLFHIFQSSGSGKTKLCLELIAELKCGCYFVRRSADSPGFPLGSSWARELVRKLKQSREGTSAVHLWLAFIRASVEVFTNLSDDQIKAYFFADSVVENEPFATAFRNACSRPASTLVREIRDLLAGVELFPLVIDEVQELLMRSQKNSSGISFYESLLMAMSKLKDLRLVAICLGTKSSLSDFALTAAVWRGNLRLPRPFSFTSSFDVALHQEPRFINYDSMTENPLGSVYVPSALMEISRLAGRPLWSTKESLLDAMKTAFGMLQNDAAISNIAAFIMRMGSPLSPQDTFSHRLVLSGLATLRFFDDSEGVCEVNYSVEPVAANVARSLNAPLYSLDAALKDYLDRLNRGAMHDLGQAGELVARIILMRVQDSLGEFFAIPEGKEELFFPHEDVNRSVHYPLVTVVKLRDFLRRLGDLTDAELAEMQLSDAMLDGLVHLSQHFQMKRDVLLNQVTLAHAFVRGVCFILPNKFEAIDLLIPVFRSDNTLSCLLVQVKNLSQQSILKETSEGATRILDSLHPDVFNLRLNRVGSFKNVPGHETAKVVMQFRPLHSRENTLTKKVMQASRGSNVLWLLGLDAFAHLFAGCGALDSLNEIIFGDRDFIKAIPFTLTPHITALQNTRAGIKAQLSAFTVLESREYLLLTDSQCVNNANTREAFNQIRTLGLDLSDLPKTFKIAIAPTEEGEDESSSGPSDHGPDAEGNNQNPTQPPSPPPRIPRKRSSKFAALIEELESGW